MQFGILHYYSFVAFVCGTQRSDAPVPVVILIFPTGETTFDISALAACAASANRFSSLPHRGKWR
ncbi:hypothetical protein [Burkholderia ubonensis]|uniref:hypothetical protein n=1 Tax=Burkholderia ubonensis TaxID=101571 RepID=UPI001160C549|nr:hypothetical protein [Burkholderia ubonensis]